MQFDTNKLLKGQIGEIKFIHSNCVVCVYCTEQTTCPVCPPGSGLVS